MASTSSDLVFYDGTCGLCHHAVRFLLDRDDGTRFRFAPLDGETFREQVEAGRASQLPDSIVVLTPDGELLIRSRAVIHLLGRLGAFWRGVGRIASLFPRALLDVAYDGVATVRRRIFARPVESCPVLPGHLRSRFLP